MSNKGFEKAVLDRLSSIESRLSSIEESLDGIGDFASDIISDESSPLNMEMLESLRSTLSSLSMPLESLGASQAPAADNMSFEEVMGSLTEFKERIAGIREVMAGTTEQE